MTTVAEVSHIMIPPAPRSNRHLAPSITWAASKQSYYTVRALVDRDRIGDAYRAYAYFRWVDDLLDEGGLTQSERMVFLQQQRTLVERCYRGDWPEYALDEERLLVELIQGDQEPDSGLQSYIRHMMAVMAFDAYRRGRLISTLKLNDYTHWLAVAVTEALHHFIGYGCQAPQNELRYLAATGAHITHMLRDTLEDVEAGYINIPQEIVENHRVDPSDVGSDQYRTWVRNRVQMARDCFRAGREYLAQVENGRCRLAGYAYIARFENVLEAIEHDGYVLRADYPECKSLSAFMKLSRSSLVQTLNDRCPIPVYCRFSVTQG